MDGKYSEAESHMEALVKGDTEVSYEARVAHLQILIHLDKYEKALNFLEEEGNFPPSKLWEERLCLYKAVVYTMLDKDDNAEKWWNKYLETLGNDNPLLSLKNPAKVEENSFFSDIIRTKVLF
ncbi:hypothetical protein E6C27_scaffold318G00210 [Cucumis melo var. makuwa]|uniref:Uncharacterized protein n=1 Tax=Cucumis melo var. makuwa TaxID=1194695 RepID=A0A5A7UHF5_CUCMM|nr:hypothetical protein E6C27_scaffold318G00210 [Cucumis melo var. makuwa]